MNTPALVRIDLVRRLRTAGAALAALTAMIGLVGGFVIAAATAAARTVNAYDRLLDDLDAPDLLMVAGCVPDNFGGCREGGAGEDPGTHRTVASARRFGAVKALVETSEGANPDIRPGNETGCFDQDRGTQLLALSEGGPADQALPLRLRGRLPRPGEAGIVVARATAERIGVSIGDPLFVVGHCVSFGEGDDVARLRTPIELTITGLGIGPIDVEPPGEGYTVEPMYADPAIVGRLVAAGAIPVPPYAVTLDPDAPAAEVEAFAYAADVAFDLRARAEIMREGLRADANVLWLLAGMVAGLGVLMVVPLSARQLRATDAAPDTMAALGAARGERTRLRAAAALALGSIGAFVGAAAAALITPTLPTGLARAIEPDPGRLPNGTVVLLVVAVAIAALVAGAVVVPRRPGPGPGRQATPAGAGVARHLPLAPPEDTGVRDGLGASVLARARPWAGVVAIALAVAAVAASVTFLAGLRRLEGDPALAGLVFDGAVQAAPGTSPEELAARIGELPGVAAAAGGTLFPPVFLQEPGSRESVWAWSFDTGPGALAPTMARGRVPGRARRGRGGHRNGRRARHRAGRGPAARALPSRGPGPGIPRVRRGGRRAARPRPGDVRSHRDGHRGVAVPAEGALDGGADPRRDGGARRAAPGGVGRGPGPAAGRSRSGPDCWRGARTHR